MNFEIEVTEGGKESWREPYSKPEIRTEEAAEEWARNTVQRFNETLRPGEQPRTLLRIICNSAKPATNKQRRRT